MSKKEEEEEEEAAAEETSALAGAAAATSEVWQTIVPSERAVADEPSRCIKLAYLCLRCLLSCCLMAILAWTISLIFVERFTVKETVKVIEQVGETLRSLQNFNVTLV
jgi:hypothetical protein